MPNFRIETNLPADKIPAGLGERITKLLAEVLNRRYDLCTVSIFTDLYLSFGGSTEPTAQTSLVAIERGGAEQVKKYSELLINLLNKELGISKDRIVLSYANGVRELVGYKGTTFADLPELL